MRGVEECEINNNNNNSDDEYLEGQHESEEEGAYDNADDEEVPATRAFIQHLEDPPSFMCALDLDAMGAPEFPDYVNIVGGYVAGGELHVGMEFSDRKAVIQAIKDYNISKSTYYKVFELEPTTLYCKCKHFGRGCEWLVRPTFRKKDLWENKKI